MTETARQELTLPERDRRSLGERIVLVTKALVGPSGALIRRRLPPGSRLRRSALAWGMRSQFGAINRRDIDLFLVRCHPEVEFDITGASGLLLDMDESYQGHEGVRRFLHSWLGGWGRYRVEMDEMVDTDGDQVLVVGRQVGRGEISGAEVTRPLAFVVTFREGLAARIQAFWDPAEARAEIGL
jgi:ketosteroid isomerase-like protein